MIQPTNRRDLVPPLVVVAGLSYLLLRLLYFALPPFQWYIVVTIVAIAALECVLGRQVRRVVRHEEGARPMTPFAIARSVALGKASARGAAMLCGAALALLLRVVPEASRLGSAAHDLQVSLGVTAGSLLLAAAGLFLERAGLDPHRDR